MYLSIDQRQRTLPYENSPTPVIETLLEKGSGPINEDVLACDNNLFGVFDGATSLVQDDLPSGLTGGLIAARLAAESFTENDGELPELAKRANQRIAEFCPDGGPTPEERFRLWSTSLAVVRLDDKHFDYCQTGDSLILVIGKDDTFTVLTPEIDQDRHTLRLWKDTPAPGDMTIHDLLADQIRSVRMKMNVTYGALNGEPAAMDFLRHGSCSLDGIGSILIFTDGLFLPRQEPDQGHDWQTFVELFRQGGLRLIHERIRAVQSLDPRCRTYPRFKCHDDVAAVAITL